ncbi:cobalamin B12-binding domain-containing protein [Sphingomonas japonica]|uniref:Methanogenic corrinoid protein MtbC1 n=1 Tax=Sphingomonas japonica TaxID=511662 RepID=A0ABX0U1N4_9SPHN|nr:cobalamin-dependent protein [Sphingomonas japonica]NIJ24473.1 methanogenic corrinoid protein MtbC1 [Sphingomonas japonica]
MASSYRVGQAATAYAPPTRRASGSGAERRRKPGAQVGPIVPASLSALIECEVIPRLMVAHPAHRFGRPTEQGAQIDPLEVAMFAPLTMQVEADELLAQIEAMLDRGIGVETLLLDLLAPTAKALGEYWEQDRCDFVDVTMGLWRLQEIVHELSDRIPAERAGGEAASALFAPVPGDQHSFGTVVVEELFARNGWSTDRLCDATHAMLADRLADEWFDLIGLTASCECHIAALPSAIAALRSVSRNPHLCVMVGGPVFTRDPSLADQVGADGTARDARAALEVAEALLGAATRKACCTG